MGVLRGGVGCHLVPPTAVPSAQRKPQEAFRAPTRAGSALSAGLSVPPARTACTRYETQPARSSLAQLQLQRNLPRCSRCGGHGRTVSAAVASGDDAWWNYGSELPNESAVSSTAELLQALSSAAPDQLVVVHFFAQWCGACKALHPKVRDLLSRRCCRRFADARVLTCIHALTARSAGAAHRTAQRRAVPQSGL